MVSRTASAATLPSLTVESRLGVDPDSFWDAFGMDAVNRELSPLVAMTCPDQWKQSRVPAWQTGRVLFRSWVLLFGFLPIDRHAFRLHEVNPGRGFRESSSSWMNREWNHDRWTVTVDGGCVLTDRVSIAGRVPFLTKLAMPIYRMIFRHRHARLRRQYGDPR